MLFKKHFLTFFLALYPTLCSVLLFCLLLGPLFGCGAQVENYVKDRRPDVPLTTNPTIVSSPMSLKLTPGKLKGNGPRIAVSATVTATDQTYILGGDKAVSLTISRTRVSPQ